MRRGRSGIALGAFVAPAAVVALVVSLVAFVGAASRVAAGEYVESSPRTADIVFATSRIDWRERQEPPAIAYVLTERYESRGASVAQVWRATYRTGDRCLTLRAVPAPSGAPSLPVLAPYLVPNASFGVARRELAPVLGDAADGTSCAPPGSFPTPAPVASLGPSSDRAAERVHEIVRVSATLHDYTIDFPNTEVVDGVDCWHLTLRPRLDPVRDRLREAWMAVGGASTIRLRVRGLFPIAPYEGATWTVDYALAGGTFYLRRIATDDVLRFGDRSTAAHVAFEFSDYAFPRSIPAGEGTRK